MDNGLVTFVCCCDFSDDDSKWRCYVCDPTALKNCVLQCDQIIETIEKQQKLKLAEKERQKHAANNKNTPKQGQTAAAKQPVPKPGPASFKKQQAQKPGPASFKQQQAQIQQAVKPKAGPASYKQKFITQNQVIPKMIPGKGPQVGHLF